MQRERSLAIFRGFRPPQGGDIPRDPVLVSGVLGSQPSRNLAQRSGGGRRSIWGSGALRGGAERKKKAGQYVGGVI